MEKTVLPILTIGVVVLVGAFLLMFPRIARRGLLFGVYVGEEAAESPEARRLKARWPRAILGWIALSLAVGWFVTQRFGPMAAYVTALLALVAGYYVEYVRSYHMARALASDAPPPVAVAYVTAVPAARPLLAYFSLTCAVAAGLAVFAYTWLHATELPARIPVHFNLTGQPDGFRARSFGSVWMLPLLTLVLGTMLPVFAVLTARAKRAVRQGDGGLSLAVQERFRAVMSSFLAVVALFMTGLLTVLSIGTVRVAIGVAKSLPPLVPVIAILMVGVAVGGIAFLAFRFGQGGARLEAAAARAPLTDGFADNRRWVAGMFYVNRDDPSFFVEKRFGFGYTINFGNRRAVTVFVVFLLLVLGFAFGPFLLR